MVLNFQKTLETSKLRRKVLNDVIDLSIDDQIYFNLDPLFLVDTSSFESAQVEKFMYFPQKSYVCHLLNGIVDLENAHVVSSLKNILNEL